MINAFFIVLLRFFNFLFFYYFFTFNEASSAVFTLFTVFRTNGSAAGTSGIILNESTLNHSFSLGFT